jgi:hypothetical protein
MKLRFKKEYEDAIISIPSRRLHITKYNIDQDEVQAVLLKYPKYAHNFEVVKDEEGNSSVQVGTMLEGGGSDVDLLADATPSPAPKASSSRTTKKSSSKSKGKGKK